MLNVCVFIFLYALSFYSFTFFVLSMCLLYLSFLPSFFFPLFSLFLLIRIANASLPLLESKKAFDVALHRPSLSDRLQAEFKSLQLEWPPVICISTKYSIGTNFCVRLVGAVLRQLSTPLHLTRYRTTRSRRRQIRQCRRARSTCATGNGIILERATNEERWGKGNIQRRKG